eukprot:g3512.t1
MALAPRAMNVAPGPKGVTPMTFDEGWAAIEKNGIRRLHRIVEKGLKVSYGSKEFMRLYSVVYTMCTQKAPQNWSGKLYFAHRKSLEQYLSDTVKPAVMKHQGDLAMFLRELHERWENHKVILKWMVKIFAYVDRFYVPRLAIDDLHTVGMKAFQKMVFEDTKEQAARAMVAMVARDRNNASSNVADQRLMRNVAEMFMVMGNGNDRVYTEFLEKPLLEAAAFESARDAKNWASKYSLSSYLQRAETRLEEETDRVHYYLQKSTLPKLMKVCEEGLLASTQEDVLSDAGDGLATLLKGYARHDLLRLYRLYSRLPEGLASAAKHFRGYVTNEATGVMESSKSKPKQLIDSLIKTLAQFERLVDECFHGDNLFKESMNSGFEQASNVMVQGKKKMPELLCDALDHILRKKPTTARIGLGMDTPEEKIDSITKLFVFLRDKDVFNEFYRKQLAKRLLLGRSGGDELEQRVLSNLKARCGAQYTAKFEGMLTDMRLAADVQTDFADYMRDPDALTEASQGELAATTEDKSPQKKAPKIDPSRLACELSVNVLTQGFWPSYKQVDLSLCAELDVAKSIFENFYCMRTANRKLRWVHTLGSVVVQGSFNQGASLEMTMSTFQACILMLFNRREAQSLKGIAQALKLEIKDVSKQLVPLVFGKYPILKPVGETASKTSLKPEERVCINHSFRDASKRIRIPLAISKTSDKERDAVSGDVLAKRKHQTEAVIVRIMKEGKKINHDNLVAKTIQRLSHLFQAKAELIKPRIEDLISRDYLERDDDDPSMYEYVL